MRRHCMVQEAPVRGGAYPVITFSWDSQQVKLYSFPQARYLREEDTGFRLIRRLLCS